MNTLKAFQIGDDLYAANSAEQAAQLFTEQTGDACDEEVRELTDDELDAPQPEYDEDEQPTDDTTSVRQMLREHGDEPGWLAATRW
jgi:hypothetical protein